jgi:hypothetical protein
VFIPKQQQLQAIQNNKKNTNINNPVTLAIQNTGI